MVKSSWLKKKYIYIYLPVIHVPLKLLGDKEPASHSSREIPDARGALEPEESGLPVKRTVAAMTKPSTTTATKQPARNRRQFRCLFFVIMSWNNRPTPRVIGSVQLAAELGNRQMLRTGWIWLPTCGSESLRRWLRIRRFGTIEKCTQKVASSLWMKLSASL